nr:molybdopterin-dependent oxidoreductase [Rhodoferax sp.]
MNEQTFMGACPLDCPDGCAWQVTVRDGVAIKLHGRSDHPMTHGMLCAKVNHYLEHTAAPDRLLYPMRRTGPKGSGTFSRITWDDALGEIAERFQKIITQHGGEAIWPYQGTGTLGFLQGIQGRAGSRLWNVLGASNHDMTICSIAGLVGLEYTIGAPRGIEPEALADAQLILLWGVNTLTSGHHQWRFVQAARKRGAYVVVIDPVRTRTARQADEHLAPIPGTDAALALGLLHTILALGAEDREYLARHTLGWDAFRRRILEYPPERVAAITGIDASCIVALGTRIAHTRPTAIRTAQGVQRHAGGGMTLRTLACIPGVTGDWRRPGGGLVYTTDGYFGANRAALVRDDLRERPVRSLSMTRLGEGLLDVQDPPVKALIVYAANPMASTPHQQKIRQGLLRDDLFTVVIEQFATDTADYADLVLPATMQTEHADLHDGYGHIYLAWNEPAVAPPGECLSTSETFRRLARRMGLTESALFDSDEELAAQLLDSDHPSLSGITLDRLRREGWVRLNYPTPFVPFADGFPTPSGKLEFFSARAEADGHDPLPGYTPPREVEDANLATRYPFVLVVGASHYAINTIFANHPSLSRRSGPPTLVIHPTDATARGMASGQSVRVFNDRGAFAAALLVSDAVRPGVLATTKGAWPKNGGGTSINATVDERDADMGGGAVFGDNRVDIEPSLEGSSTLTPASDSSLSAVD